MKVLLFDIDCTLIITGNAGNKSITRAFDDLYGLKEAMVGIKPHGNTDPAIVKDIFKTKLGKNDVSQRQVDEVLNKYISILPEEIQKSQGYKVLPGIIEILKEVDASPDLVAGLATGNLERSGRIKLERGELNKYLRFGGFADGLIDRNHIIEKAIKKAEEFIGQAVNRSDVYVIGDTPRDIIVGKNAGAKTVAIATGIYGLEELKSHNPDYLFQDLSDYKSFLNIFS